MKKALVVLALASIGFAKAQQSEGIEVGAKAGLNVANLVYKDSDYETDYKAGFVGGAYAEIHLGDHFSVQPELLYAQLGGKDSYSKNDYKEENKYSLDYIQIPVMARYYVGNNQKFYLEAGPQVGFNIRAEDESEETYNGTTYSDTQDIKDGIQGVDFGLNAGLGYKIDKFNINARYGMGLIDLNKNNDNNIETHNSVFSIGLGYTFFNSGSSSSSKTKASKAKKASTSTQIITTSGGGLQQVN